MPIVPPGGLDHVRATPPANPSPSQPGAGTPATPANVDPPPENSFRAHVWDAGDGKFVYPEQALGMVPKKKKTAVCMSGGGNRAMVAAWGQFRGLREAGLIENVDYVSCVSGGSWASTAYTYYSDGAKDDEEFLGEPRSPGKLNLAALGRISPVSLGAAATDSFMSALISQSLYVPTKRILPNEVWIRAVGQTFFERFGLYNMGDPGYMSLDDKTVAEIRSRNPALAGRKFYTVRTKDGKRPYLVVNSTLLWPGAGDSNLVHFEYSPVYAGSKQRLTVYSPPGDTSGQKATVGGGFLETFAFGSQAPRDWPPSQDCGRYAGSDGCVVVGQPREPFSLTFASGTSSAAFAATNASIAGGNFLLRQYLSQGPPIAQYWPVPSTEGDRDPGHGVYTFGDGGSLDNYGLIPMLLRGVENIVVFINTERRLSLEYDPSDLANNPPSITQLDGQLPTFFGAQPLDRNQPPMPNNQVFSARDFTSVVRALQQAKRSSRGENGAAVATTTLEVLDNDWWGLTGGWKTNVTWVYLDRVSEWEGAIDPELSRLVEAANNAGPKDKIPFWGFPNYKTMFQSGKIQIISMRPQEANLLADFTSWVVTDSAGARTIADALTV